MFVDDRLGAGPPSGNSMALRAFEHQPLEIMIGRDNVTTVTTLNQPVTIYRYYGGCCANAFNRTMKITPVLLIILDGYGHREECDFNAICQARKPHWNFLWATYPHSTINASEHWVGLPDQQMGNSEVGHMNIGAGRVVYQDYTRIEKALQTGELFRNPDLGSGRIGAYGRRCTTRPVVARGVPATSRKSTPCGKWPRAAG
jgi:hypothetical protein